MKSYNPTTAAFADSAKEFGSDLYRSIKDFKENKADIETEKGLTGQLKSGLFEIKSNLIEDIKTGNFYNKQRVKQSEDAMMGAMFGEDFNDGFEDFDFEFEDDESFDDAGNDNSDIEETASLISSSNKELAGAIDVVSQKNAGAISMATVESADYIVQAGKQNSKAIYSLANRGFNQVSTGLAAVNSNISNLVKLGEPLTTHMQNASVFYTKSTENQEKALQLLEKIANNTAPLEDKKNYGSSAKNTIDSLLTDGALDIGAYFDMVKENTKSMTDMAKGMLDIVGGVEGATKMASGSPLQAIPKGIIKGLMPKLMKQTMETFDKSLQGFFTSFLGGMRGKSFDGPIGTAFDLLKGFILPKSGYKDSVSSSGYEKGKVNWDGMSRKSLLEVIPTQLSKIVAAITGEPEQRYDFESGRWKTLKSIKSEYQQDRDRYARSAGGDYIQYLKDTIAELEKSNEVTKEESKALKKQIDDFNYKAFHSNSSGFTNIMKDNFNYTDYGLTEEGWNLIRNANKAAEKQGRYDLRMQYDANIYQGRDSYGNYRRMQEADGTNLALQLYNGSVSKDDKKKSRVLLGVDDYNNDIFFYLQGIYKHTKHISDNLENLGGSGDRQSVVNGRVIHHRFKPIEELKASSSKVSDEDKEDIDKDNATKVDFTSAFDINLDDISKAILNGEDNFSIGRMNKDLREYKERKEAAEAAGAEFEKDDEKEQMLKYYEEADKLFKNSNSKLKDKLKENKFLKPVVTAVENIFQTPAEAVSGLLNAGMVSMRQVLYGEKPEEDEKGIFGYMAAGMRGIFEKLDNKIEDLFGKKPSDIFKSAFNKLFGEKDEETGRREGGKFSEFANQTSENLGQAKDWLKNLFVGNAADGRKVTKTGMIAVSEGELVIPAELNPYYHKAINKQQQRRNERNAIHKFYGSYADGGTVDETEAMDDDYMSNPFAGEGETKKFKISDDSVLGILKNFGKMGFKELGSGAKSIVNKVSGKDKRDAVAFDPLNPNINFSEVLYNDKYTVKMGKNGQLMVSDGEEDEDKDKNIIEKIISNALPEVKTKKGAMGAGAIIGAGVSLLTGGLVGPIIGAGLGAATGLVIKSENMQKLLFGEEDKPGIAGKKISEFVKKNLDKTVKGGVTGAVGGLLLGSPLLGMIAGSAAGYISSSEKAKKYLFGDDETDGKLLTKKMKMQLQKAMPRLSAGAIGGLIMGPFGSPIMNIIAGSAIGYATTHQKFHDWLMSDEENRHGNKKGLIPLLKQKLLDPIVSIFDKLAESMKHTIRNTFFGVGKLLRKAMTNVFKGAVKKLGDTWFGKAAKTVGNTLVRAPINAVGGVLKGVNTHMETKALRKGYSVKDRKLGRKLNAQERLDRRSKKLMSNNSKFGTIDKAIAEMSGNPDQLKEFSELVESMTDPTKEFDNRIRSSRNNSKEMLRNVRSKSGNAIFKALKKDDFEEAKKLLDSATDIDDVQKQRILEQISQQEQAYKDRNETKGDVKAAKKRLIDRSGLKGTLDAKGIHLKELRGLKDSDLRNIQDLIKDEEAFNKLNAEEIEKNKEKEDKQNLQDSVTKDIPDVLKDIRGILAGDEELKKKYGKKKKKKKGKNKDTNDTTEEIQVENEEQNTDDDIVDGEYHIIDEDEETADDGYYKLRDIIRNVRRNGLHVPNHRANRFTRNNGRNDENSNNQNTGNETNDGNNSELKDGDTKTVFDDNTGQTIKQIYRDPPGTWEVDTTDTDTRKAMETKQQTNAGLASLVNFVPSMGNIFGSLKEGLLGGEKEEEEGFLSKLLGGLGGIGNFLFGGGLGNIISKAIGGVLTTLGVTTLIKMLTTEGGITDKIAEKFGFGKAEAGKAEFQDKDGKTYIEMNGKYVDKETGEEFTGDNTDLTMTKGWGEAEATESLSDKTKDNFVRGTVTGKGSLIGKLTNKIPGMKTVKKLAKKVGKNAAKGIAKKTGLEQLKKNVKKSGKNLVKKMASNAENLVREKVGEALPKFIEVLGKVPVLKKVIGKIKVDDMVEAIAKQAEKGTKKAGAKVLKSITSAVPLLNIAFAVVDFTTGYQDASATFKVKEPTFCQKIISAVIRTLKNLIPFIGSLIPDHILVDIFVEYIAPFFGGIDGLEQQREEAQKELDAYNEENNTDMDWEEYNKEVLGNYTWTEKIGNAAKDLGSSIKNSKVGKAVGGAVKSVGGFFSKVGKGIGGFFGGGGEEKSASGSGLPRPQLLGFAGGSSIVEDSGVLPQDLINYGTDAVKGKVQDKIISSLASEESTEIIRSTAALANERIRSGVVKFIEFMQKIPLLRRVVANIHPERLADDIARAAGNGITKLGNKLAPLAKGLSKAAIPITIATAVIDFTTGYQDARTTFKIKNPETWQKIVSGLLRMIKNVIPFIGALISDQALINIFINHICPALNIDPSKLNAQRDEAEKELEAYNKENNTDMDWEEYNKEVLGNYTWTERVGNTVKGAVNKIKSGIAGFFGRKKSGGRSGLLGFTGGASGIGQEENTDQSNDTMTKARKKRNTLNKFKETVSLQNTTSPIENTIQLVTRVGANIEKHIADGNIMGIWSEKLDTNGIDREDQQSSMITPFAQGMLSSMKLIGTIPAGVKFTIDTATSLWEKLTGGADGGFKSLTAAVDKMSASSKDGDFTGVWNTKLELSNENDALNPVYKIAFTIAKVFQTVSAVWNVIMNKVKEFTESGIGGGILSIINKFMGNDSSNSETSDSVSSTTTSTDSSTSEDKLSSKDKNKKKKENKKEFVTFEQTVQNKSKTKTSGGKNGPKIDYSSKDNFNTSMSNSNPLSASGSGFVSQLDPKFTNMSLGGSSIADMGCGPASAVMALNNRGKQASMDDAVNEANRYQTEGGTDIGYFGDIFKKNGLNPKYYGVSGGSSLINDIQSGNQVVLMGQDKNNRSKMNSPFGPNNHYVVATGMDHLGNVIVNDPELNRPGAIYSPSILKSVKAAVSAGRSKLKSRSYPKFFGIAGAGKKKKNKKSNGAKKAKDIKEQVYAFFTNNGFTPAAACGIMGNIEAESGWNPALKQVNGPAKGLFQMQGGRFNEMEKIAKKNGKDWTDLDSQLEFFLKDFHSSENNHYFTIAPKLGAKYENVPPLPASSCEKFKKLDDPVIAAAIFMSCWERCAFKDSLSHWTTRRKANAEAYYKKYADKNYVYDGNASFNGTTDNSSGSNDDSGSSSSSSNPGVLNEIIGAFSNAFGIVFGGGEENNSSSSTSDTSGDNSSVADGGEVTWKNGGKDPIYWMESKLGKLKYSQSNRSVDAGYGDCSSTVAWAIKKAGGPTIGSCTRDEIKSPKLEVVWDNKGGAAPSKMPANAQRNDLLFWGNGNTTSDRLYGVSHVDMYAGNGMKLNHGGPRTGDPGTTKSQVRLPGSSSHKLIRIMRVKGMTVPADESTKKGKTKKADMSYAKYLKLPKKASNGKPWNKYSPGSANTIDDQNYVLWKKWQIPKKASNGKPWSKYSPGGSGNTKDDQYYALWSEMQEYKKKKNKKKSGKGSGLSDTIVNKLYDLDREQRANILDTSYSNDNEIYRAFNRLKEHDLLGSNTDIEEHELANRTNTDVNQISKGTLNNERIGKVVSLDQARRDRIKSDRKINPVNIKHITRENRLRGTIETSMDQIRNNRSNRVRNKIENSIPDIKHVTRDNQLRGTVTDRLDQLRNNKISNRINTEDVKHLTSQDRIRDRLTNALSKEREKRNRTTINLDNIHDIKHVTREDHLTGNIERDMEQIRKDRAKNSRKIDTNNHAIERASRDPERLRDTANKIKTILNPNKLTNTNISHEEFKKIIEQQREERKKNNTNKKIENTKENTSGISKEVALMMKTMITLVEELVGNTKSIEQIYELLGERIPEKTDTNNTNKSLKNSDQTPHHRKYSDEERAQRSLSALKATMDEILAS